MKRLMMCLLLTTALCSAGTITFEEVPLPDGAPVTNQYEAFGILCQNAYYYIDSRDTFDGVGISILGTSPGIVTFTSPTDGLSIDYWVIQGTIGTYSAFNSADTLLDSFTVDATGSTDLLGTYNFADADIAMLEFSGNPGYIQVSTLRFESVPEPYTWTLILAGLAAVALRRYRRNSLA